jgi:hypothetical protein
VVTVKLSSIAASAELGMTSAALSAITASTTSFTARGGFRGFIVGALLQGLGTDR